MNKIAATTGVTLRNRAVFILLVLLFGFMNVAFSSDKKIDIQSLITDTQKQSSSVDKLEIIWWIPEEFWRASFQQSSDITADKIDQFIKIIRSYTVIVAIDGDIGVVGGITYKSLAAIQSSLQLVDVEGTHYRPLNDEKIDADTKNLLTMMKPVFVNMLGAMGQNMNIFLFPAKNEKGENFIDAKKEGGFSIMLGSTEFKWKLPLGSLLPSKICPVDGEKLSGAWKFCPWHGIELKQP